MNKKGEYISVGDIIGIALVVGIIFLAGYGVSYLKSEYDNYKEYKNFCEDKPNFCYCSLMDGCTFKTQYTTSSSLTNGILTSSSETMSQDTKELCNLAKKLNDKKTIFEVGC
jgi:hypothetical protein